MMQTDEKNEGKTDKEEERIGGIVSKWGERERGGRKGGAHSNQESADEGTG